MWKKASFDERESQNVLRLNQSRPVQNKRLNFYKILENGILVEKNGTTFSQKKMNENNTQAGIL